MNGRQLSDFESTQLTESLEENLRFLHRIFEKDQILRVRHLSMERCVSIPCALLFIDSMVNSASLNDSVVRPLLEADVPNRQRTLVDYVCRQVLFACEVKATANLREMLRSMLYGDTLLLIDGCNEGIVINTKGWPTRGVTEPEDERILQGPREGFGEAAMKNITLLRRRLPTPDFCVETQYLGRRTDTLVMICYLGSLVKPQTLAMLKERLAKVDIDSVLDTNYIAEMIRDHRLSLFKTTGSTERPDIVAARLLEGRVALVVDGTPVVLTIPYLFVENFQSDDDYYLNFWVATVGRMLRHVCFFLSFSLPALYLALVGFHPQLMPVSFLINITASRTGIPVSSLGECLLLLFVFEVLKETGMRMPQSMGHALSIVGGLVVGQAAVQAKIISAPMLIVVALSGIAGLMIPRLRGAVVYYRVGFVLLAAWLGLYGCFLGWLALGVRVVTLSSFDADYAGDAAALTLQSGKDTVWRAPWWLMKTRPASLTRNRVRNRTDEGEIR